MVQCKKCKLFVSLSKDELVKCKGACEAVYHKKCVQSNKQFLISGTCDDCQPAKHSPIQVKTAQDPKPATSSNEASGDNVLAEINKKLEVLYSVEKKIVELTASVEFYSEMYQNLMDYKEESKKKIKSLEQKNVYLEKYNKALEERVQELEAKGNEKNIEIHGLEMHNQENIKTVVEELATKLNLNPNDIEDAQRVGREKPGDTKPKIVLVALRTKSARNNWMLARKENQITNNKVYANGSDKRIFINEDLPKYKRQLLWTVRNQLKPKGFQYIWVQDCSILVKKNSEEKKIYNIRSEEDLKKFEECK